MIDIKTTLVTLENANIKIRQACNTAEEAYEAAKEAFWAADHAFREIEELLLTLEGKNKPIKKYGPAFGVLGFFDAGEKIND